MKKVLIHNQSGLRAIEMPTSTNDWKAFLFWERVVALLLVSITVVIIFNDAYKIENGVIQQETTVWASIYLADGNYDRFTLSFNPGELNKVFWWESFVDMGLGRLATAVFQLVDVKFRAWLFQYIPPNPAISLSWLLGLIFIPLLLFKFLKRYIGLGIVGSTAITVLFLVSPATIGYTFQNLHPGKTLAVFFMILILNICMTLDDLVLSQDKDNKKNSRALIFLGITLYLSLFTDPYIFVIFLLIPILFPQLFKEPFRETLCRSTGKTETENGHKNLLIYLIGALPRLRKSIYMVMCLVIAGYFLSFFFVIPWLSGKSGYPFEHMSTLNNAAGGFPFRAIFNLEFYPAIFLNMYWFVIGNVGLRKYLPLYVGGLETFGAYYPITHYVALLTFFLFNMIMVGVCYIGYRFSSQKRNIFYCLAALYVTMGWITLIHGTQNYYYPWSNFYYGAIFPIVFAILGGGVT